MDPSADQLAHAKDLQALLEQAREDPAILGVILFGSAARGETHQGSDLDVCLILEPPDSRSSGHAASDLARKRMGYLHFNLDVKLFQQLPLYIRRRILKEGRVLLAKDESRMYEVALSTARAFDDFQHIHHDYLETVARGGS